MWPETEATCWIVFEDPEKLLWKQQYPGCRCPIYCILLVMFLSNLWLWLDTQTVLIIVVNIQSHLRTFDSRLSSLIL